MHGVVVWPLLIVILKLGGTQFGNRQEKKGEIFVHSTSSGRGEISK